MWESDLPRSQKQRKSFIFSILWYICSVPVWSNVNSKQILTSAPNWASKDFRPLLSFLNSLLDENCCKVVDFQPKCCVWPLISSSRICQKSKSQLYSSGLQSVKMMTWAGGKEKLQADKIKALWKRRPVFIYSTNKWDITNCFRTWKCHLLLSNMYQI